MANIDKIKKRAKEKGITLTHVCQSIGQGVYYFNDVKKRDGNIPPDRLEKIAEILDTTVAYLTDQTDNPSPVTNDPTANISEKTPKPTEDDIKVALFGGDGEVTDEMWNEVKKFAAYVKEQNQKKK